MSWWFVGLGYVLLTAGIVITAWAQGVNRFFEPGVRIQTERGHHVIDSGPYAIIRHPGYFAAFLLMAGIALSLGSWWALIGSGVGAVILVIRTILEERTLGAELPGYTDYTRRVRFRLLPGIW
jgi:protein-S-isoprenylcysteine O-methyltransferase Ste14